METGINKNEIIALVANSPHGDLKQYVPISQRAAREEAEFFQRFIAWNHVKGQIRDSKVALPVIALGAGLTEPEFRANSLAHLALLAPRDLVRAYRFAREIKTPGAGMAVKRLLAGYLRKAERNYAKWERMAVQHRNTLRELYALAHVKPAPFADAILFKGERPMGSIFEAIAELKNMDSLAAAGTILEKRIPFLVAMGALGAKMKDSTLVMALIDRMSPTELVTNTKMLERLGIKTDPALRAAYQKAMERAATSKKATLKTTRAAEAIEDAEETERSPIADKLRDLQERQLNALGGIEGDWAVLADKSGSMAQAIEVAREISGILSRMVKGKIYLIFFDTHPTFYDVTGKTYEEIKEITKFVKAGGGTSIGCGLMSLAERHLSVDGVAVVSDGEENQFPQFAAVYRPYCKFLNKDIPVYFYRTVGGMNVFTRSMKDAGLDLQEFDLTRGVDYHSLPNLVKTMRTQRYSLLDEIMSTPLLRLEDIFEGKEEAVHA